MKETDSLIRNRDMARQLIDFSGLDIDGYIYPTDIDGLIEYKNKKYILFEIKHQGTDVPFGQKLALERMVKDFTTAGKDAIVFVCTHINNNPEDDVDAKSCIVKEFYYGKLLRWVEVTDVIITLGVASKVFKNNPQSFLDSVRCNYKPVQLLRNAI